MPVLPKLDELFLWAIDHYLDLYEGKQQHEQNVLHDGREWTIADVADAATECDEPMPDEVRIKLHRAAPLSLRQEYLAPPGDTYVVGGRCLRAMYDRLKEQLRDRRVWLPASG